RARSQSRGKRGGAASRDRRKRLPLHRLRQGRRRRARGGGAHAGRRSAMSRVILKHSLVGTRVVKLDAADKVTGRTRYINDLALPRMLYAKILRSEHVHANIVRIDTAKATALPGVVAVITAADTPEIAIGV